MLYNSFFSDTWLKLAASTNRVLGDACFPRNALGPFGGAAAPGAHPRRALFSPGRAAPVTNRQRDAERRDGVKFTALCTQNNSEGE